LLFLALLVALPIDFATLDAPLLVGGARAVQWDDEEDSVPSRRQRADGEERRAMAPRPTQPALARSRPAPSLAAAARPDRRAAHSAWTIRIRSAPGRSPAPASPADDH
jgi:hypothetical protein